MNILQETALKWVEQGIGVLPIRYHQKEPDARALKRASGSVQWEHYQDRLPSEWEVKCMFPSSLNNLAIITGWNGLTVLDFDNREAFFDWWGIYQVKTYMVLTARGVHVYLFSGQHVMNRKGKGLDVKAAGGYVLAPPSIHPTGAEYTVLLDLPILRVESIEQLLPVSLFPPAEQPKPTVGHSGSFLQGQQGQNTIDDPWKAIEGGYGLPGQDLIKVIREKISLLDYLPGAQQSSGDGRWWMVECPFHDDHRPSMWIDTQRGICGCYTCGFTYMDVINLYAALRGIDNRAAIFQLSKLI